MPTTATIRTFWDDQLAHLPTPTVSATPVHGLTDTVSIDDVTFTGAHGDPIRGWFTHPTNSPTRGVVVEYLGYGRGRGKPFERLWWAAAGFAHLLMDTRGQGSQYGTGGDTPDPHGSSPHVPGFLTQGADAPKNLYYVRLILDAVAAVSAAENSPDTTVTTCFCLGTPKEPGSHWRCLVSCPDSVASWPTSRCYATLNNQLNPQATAPTSKPAPTPPPTASAWMRCLTLSHILMWSTSCPGRPHQRLCPTGWRTRYARLLECAPWSMRMVLTRGMTSPLRWWSTGLTVMTVGTPPS